MQKELHILELPIPAGRSDAHTKMFFENLGLVNFVVNKIGLATFRSTAALERSDLVQFGMLGLLDAIEKFNPERGVQFQTYAVSRIKGSIQDELRKLDWVPRSVRRAERQAEAIAQRAGQVESRTTTALDIARRLSLSLEKYAEIIHQVNKMGATSPDAPEYASRLDALSTDEKDDPSEIANQQQLKNTIVDAVEQLPERDRLIVMLYYYEDLTFKEIAAVLRISESRVFQIHTTVLGNLRTKLAGSL